MESFFYSQILTIQGDKTSETPSSVCDLKDLSVKKITNLMSKEELEKHMLDSFKHKFAKKPDVIEPNMQAVIRAYNEAKEV